MCGRYVSPEEAAIERAVEVQRRSWAERFRAEGLFGRRYNVSPTDPVPVVRVVREVDGQREGVHLRWGLIPFWAKGKPMGNTINARIETVRTNSSFRDAWQRGSDVFSRGCGIVPRRRRRVDRVVHGDHDAGQRADG